MDERRDPRFHTTRWSLVASVGRKDADTARAALEELCATYWYPLYAYLRRRGTDEHEAADLTQGFFAALIEKDYVGQADRERGRFRTFLLAALKHFASKEWQKARAQKRGGGRRSLPLDFEVGESRYRREPTDDVTPETLYEKRWAHTVLDRAMAALAEHYRGGTQEQADRFEALKPLLSGMPTPPYKDLAERLGMSETAVKVAAHRLRRRYRDVLRREIAETVSEPTDVDDEIHRLLEALRS